MPMYQISKPNGEIVATVSSSDYVTAMRPFVSSLKLDPRLCRGGDVSSNEGCGFTRKNSNRRGAFIRKIAKTPTVVFV